MEFYACNCAEEMVRAAEFTQGEGADTTQSSRIDPANQAVMNCCRRRIQASSARVAVG